MVTLFRGASAAAAGFDDGRLAKTVACAGCEGARMYITDTR